MKSVENVLKKWGAGSILRLGDEEVLFVSVIPTGSFALDLALGVGGFPRGRIAEVYGPELSGKTTLALHAIAECQKMGDNAAIVDAEHSLDREWAHTCGVNVDDLYVSQPEYGEQALDIVELLLPDFGLVVVDSVAALVPKAELEGEVGDAHIALQARMMSQAMRRLAGQIKKNNSVVIFTNQLRQKIGIMFGSPEVTSGGKALGYYTTVRIDLRKREIIKEREEVVGNIVRATVKKNKVAAPFRVAEFKIYYDEGISKAAELADFGIVKGLIEKGGAGWFTIKIGEEQKVQGEPALRRFFLENSDVMRKLENEFRQANGLPLWEIGKEK